MRPLLSITFHQEFRKSKKFGQWTSGSGGKKTVKRSEKVWWTNTQTNKHADISIYLKNWPRGPILWKCVLEKGELKKYQNPNSVLLKIMLSFKSQKWQNHAELSTVCSLVCSMQCCVQCKEMCAVCSEVAVYSFLCCLLCCCQFVVQCSECSVYCSVSCTV